MNIKILTLSLVIALTACQSTAKEEVEDELDKTAGFYSSAGLGYAVSDSENSLSLSIQLDTKGKAIPLFMAYNSECKRFSEKEIKVESSRINGTLVRMVKQCFKEGWYAFSPKSKKGQEHLIDILKTKSLLTIDSYKFKTKGYNHFSKLLENEEGGL